MIPLFIATALSTSSIAEMRWEKRVLLVSAPDAGDVSIVAQRRALAGWDREARDRDLTIVTVIGGRVSGSDDTAAGLRDAHRLPADRFAAVLIGKDGGEKLRSARPIAAATLAETIDSMPMRRAGGR